MTAVWIAIASAISLLVGQWASTRLFKRLKDIEDRQDAIDVHLRSTDAKVEGINKSGSDRADIIQQMYWEQETQIRLVKQWIGMKDTDDDNKHKKEGPTRWPQR